MLLVCVTHYKDQGMLQNGWIESVVSPKLAVDLQISFLVVLLVLHICMIEVEMPRYNQLGLLKDGA